MPEVPSKGCVGPPLDALSDRGQGLEASPAIVDARLRTDQAPTTLTDALIRLAEAEDTLRAIGAGEVDAFVVGAGGADHSVATLSTADRPYRVFVEDMSDAAATLSSSGLILWANRRLAELLSCSRDSIVGSPLAMFVAGDVPIWLEEIRETGGVGATVEIALVDALGVVVPVLVGFSPLDAGGDQLTCLTFTDLSAKKAQDYEIARLARAQADAQESLRESEQRYRTIVDNADEGIWIADLDGVITFANPAVARILGVALIDDLVGRSVFDFIGHGIRADIQRKLNERKGGQSETYEFPVTRLDGTEVWIRVAGTPLRDADGEVSAVLALVSDVTERHEAQELLRVQSLHDRVTGLPNRAHLVEYLRAIMENNDEVPTFALLLVDIDRFREINDTFGHDVGDDVLVELADRLRSKIRGTDFLARIGGDEFAFVAVGVTTPEAAEAVADSVSLAINGPVGVAGLEVAVALSLGVVHAPTHGTDLKTLFRRGEAATRQTKQSDRRWTLYDIDKDPHRPDLLALTAELGRALESGGLTLHYQPQVDLTTGKIEGVEALARWTHPTRGNVPPVEFVPLAERTGLALPLATWALKTALTQCAVWCEEGLSIPVSVNVTPIVLHHEAFFSTVAELLLTTGVPARFLTLELTEGDIAEPTASILGNLARLRFLGVRISIDDFGVGYSAMSYLLHFPLDELKIDKLFVQNIMEDERAWQIVTAIVGVGRSLDLRVVAEGIETDEVGKQLATLGCVGQGFSICRPAPASDITGWCLRHATGASDLDIDRVTATPGKGASLRL